MLRHSLNNYLFELKKSMRFDIDTVRKAIQYLNSLHFHKRLRNDYYNFLESSKRFQIKILNNLIARNELIMISVPKPKFFDRKIPAGRSKDDFYNEIRERQTHILRKAINRVSLKTLLFIFTHLKFPNIG